ncbi:POS9-activating factor FAP7 [Colletotrichum orchidophilum]|uniref:POS9-activating factor FAP7 n=1 Tax=Colletotrichum orchidophilum TaxID=1209926 RepID=A0A1G4AW47_9PEZI|nr:POS9-activating factor FAP7 [Colletotrichum orchidophilum]OHE93351.1 POS9-activating factor FAP7 [Colletotrichum orchidophilum]
MRTSPNIIVTGTPGVGKTTHCEELARRTGLKHLSVNQVVKDRECHEGWDADFQSWIVDEDKAKLQENLDSEIMEVLLQEAREAFDEEIVVELTSNTADEMEVNISRVEAWLEQWKKDFSL